MAKIKAVIFDFGGVLYRTPRRGEGGRWIRWLVAHDPLLEQLATAPEESTLMRKVFTGEMHETEMLSLMARRLHLPRQVVLWMFRRGFSTERFNRPLADFLAGIRSKYITAVLSNAGDSFRQIVNKAYQLEKLVDHIIISAEEGMAKPDERIYYKTCDRLGVQPEEVVFVDDLIENVEAARRLGMTAIQFLSTGQVLDELQRNLGVVPA